MGQLLLRSPLAGVGIGLPNIFDQLVKFIRALQAGSSKVNRSPQA